MNGFRSKEAQIRRLISEEGNNCIWALNDTRLHKNIQLAKIPGYSMVREDKTYNTQMATAGGVALIVPQNWSCHRVNITPLSNQCESLSVIVTPAGGSAKPFKLSTLYNHPGNHISAQFISNLKNYLFNGKSLPLLVVGDLNSPHQSFGSRTSNEYGSSLLQIINNENLIVINNNKEPTYYSNATGLDNLLDLVLSDTEMNRIITDCTVSSDIGSDHLPVVTTLNYKTSPTTRQIVNLKQWASNVDKRLSGYEESDNVDNNIQAISDIFKETKKASTFTSKSFRRYLSLDVRQYINLRHSLLKCKKKAKSELAKRVITKIDIITYP